MLSRHGHVRRRLCLAAPLLGLPAAARAAGHGLSAARLQRLHRFLQQATAEGGYLGAVSWIQRRGALAEWRAWGHRDLARREPMPRDAIFRIYSMTKTVTSVAALMLMEEGRLLLDDPVSAWLPAFGTLRVFDGGSADAPVLRAPARPVTLRHLLTHTAGFAVDGGPAGELMDRARLDDAADLHDFTERLARVPLSHDPGTHFGYDGANTDTLARVVELAAGQPFDRFLRERVFEPLRLRDTGFEVPAAQRHRIADLTTLGPDGRLRLADAPSAQAPGTLRKRYASGAGGLYATAPDYGRFARLLLEGGALDGVRLLGRKTVALMMSNQLTMLQPPTMAPGGAEGFGLGGSVLLDPARANRLGSAGQFGWSGAACTYYTIDPAERMIAMLWLQHLPRDGAGPDLPKLAPRFYNLVYQALDA